ncbi:MAG TPA: DUF1996 domain-containing protein [Micromonosporaceae bacterium]
MSRRMNTAIAAGLITIAAATVPAAAATVSAPVSDPVSAPVSAPPMSGMNMADMGGPFKSDFVSIRSVPASVVVPRVTRTGSRGTFAENCGRNLNGHHNPDNYITSPGIMDGAQHTHDYVGNLSTNGDSTDASLAAAGTTCTDGDKSTFFWPVLRLRHTTASDANAPGGGDDGNIGKIIEPTTVTLQFRGNAAAHVVAAPRFLRTTTGDAHAVTNGPVNARADWTCTGFGNRISAKYPLCPPGHRVERVLDFASCWDGVSLDSANHRTHVLFPSPTTGACPAGTEAIPQLRITLTYAVPTGRSFAVDSFPDQYHNPSTDHSDFENLMSTALMQHAVNCINAGRRCTGRV